MLLIFVRRWQGISSQVPLRKYFILLPFNFCVVKQLIDESLFKQGFNLAQFKYFKSWSFTLYGLACYFLFLLLIVTGIRPDNFSGFLNGSLMDLRSSIPI